MRVGQRLRQADRRRDRRAPSAGAAPESVQRHHLEAAVERVGHAERRRRTPAAAPARRWPIEPLRGFVGRPSPEQRRMDIPLPSPALAAHVDRPTTPVETCAAIGSVPVPDGQFANFTFEARIDASTDADQSPSCARCCRWPRRPPSWRPVRRASTSAAICPIPTPCWRSSPGSQTKDQVAAAARHALDRRDLQRQDLVLHQQAHGDRRLLQSRCRRPAGPRSSGSTRPTSSSNVQLYSAWTMPYEIEPVDRDHADLRPATDDPAAAVRQHRPLHQGRDQAPATDRSRTEQNRKAPRRHRPRGAFSLAGRLRRSAPPGSPAAAAPRCW